MRQRQEQLKRHKLSTKQKKSLRFKCSNARALSRLYTLRTDNRSSKQGVPKHAPASQNFSPTPTRPQFHAGLRMESSAEKKLLKSSEAAHFNAPAPVIQRSSHRFSFMQPALKSPSPLTAFTKRQ